jgi:hypothetical protein
VTTYLIDGVTPIPSNGDTGWGTTLSAAITAIDARFTWTGSLAVPDNLPAASISGTTLASNVISSSLTSVGTLTNLTISGATILGPAVITQQSASYTLALSDQGKIIEMTNSTAATVTVPPNTTAFPVGSQITVIRNGTGTVDFAAGGGVILLSDSANLYLSTQYSAGTLIKRATNTWYLVGNLSAS